MLHSLLMSSYLDYYHYNYLCYYLLTYRIDILHFHHIMNQLPSYYLLYYSIILCTLALCSLLVLMVRYYLLYMYNYLHYLHFMLHHMILLLMSLFH